jgi:hypothetical protein
MAYVEEEAPQTPPLAPPDSFLFSASDKLTSPLTSSHYSLEDDFYLETESFPIEEEIPTTEHEEVAPPIDESQPLVASSSTSSSTWHFSKEQLQLIFEMRRDATKQLHCQTTLYQCMDILFDALSSAPAKNRCPTCC